jgi:hypothetical protein
MKKSERREFQRFEVGFPVRVEFSRGEDFLMEETRLENLSAGGALFPSSYRWKPGDEVVLNISAPGEITGDMLGLDDREKVENLVLKSSAVVLRLQEPDAGGSESNTVAVKFVGLLRIGAFRNQV